MFGNVFPVALLVYVKAVSLFPSFAISSRKPCTRLTYRYHPLSLSLSFSIVQFSEHPRLKIITNATLGRVFQFILSNMSSLIRREVKDLAFVSHFHSLRLVIIRLETASEAVCSLVALETAWPVKALLKAIEDSVTVPLCCLAHIQDTEPRKWEFRLGLNVSIKPLPCGNKQ